MGSEADILSNTEDIKEDVQDILRDTKRIKQALNRQLQAQLLALDKGEKLFNLTEALLEKGAELDPEAAMGLLRAEFHKYLTELKNVLTSTDFED